MTPQKAEQGRLGRIKDTVFPNAATEELGWIDVFRTTSARPAIEDNPGTPEDETTPAYPGGEYVEGAGALSLGDSRVRLRGEVAVVDALASGAADRVVYVTADGELFAVEPPAPAWEVSDSDSGPAAVYDLGNGSGTPEMPWINLTGLSVVIPPEGATVIGKRVDFTFKVYARNKSSTERGAIEIGFSLNGADPQPGKWFTQPIPPNAAGSFPFSISSTSVALAPGDVVGIKARISFGDSGQFGVVIDGNTGHIMDLSVVGTTSVAVIVTAAQILSLLGGSIETSSSRFGMASARIGRSLLINGSAGTQGLPMGWEAVEAFAESGPSFGSFIPDHANSRIICGAPGVVIASLSIAGIVPNNHVVTFGIRHRRGGVVLEDRDLFFVVGSNQIQESGRGEWSFDTLMGDELIAIVKGSTPTNFTPSYLQLSAFRTSN